MVKFYFTSLFILFFSFGFSQSYPYLNASTGNENEFPVDKDTNIYMFHGSRLVKTDKNFNVIWANTYSGIAFTKLLLSKTGSIYFTGTASSNVFGKIKSDGSIGWIKGTGYLCDGLMLDRNNNLLISGGITTGSGNLVKTDTNGLLLKLVTFTGQYSYLGKLAILEDSLGYYKLFGLGLKPLGGNSFGLFTYSDATDAFVNVKDLALSSSYYNINWNVIKSKFTNNFYVRMYADLISSTNVQVIIKFTTSGVVKWNKSVISSTFWAKHLEESNNSDLLLSMDTRNSNSYFRSVIAKLDSNGVVNNYLATMLNNYFVYNFMTSNYDIPAHAPRVIHTNNYYFDISGYNFPTNPLTVQKFNSNLNYACSYTIAVTSGIQSLGALPPNATTVQVISSPTISAFVSTVTPIAFSVNPNFCTVLGDNGIDNHNNAISIYPNPVSEKIYLKETVSYVEVFDVNGKKLKTISNTSSIDVADLPEGIYFIRIKTDKGEINKKFIKE